mmetsp:Transcript_76015/g.180880  ORF Transcript_76015/g.180880 Transcript_76015/m.180880 type:complete len:466 (-) Transcript_76015:52-1449(-)
MRGAVPLILQVCLWRCSLAISLSRGQGNATDEVKSTPRSQGSRGLSFLQQADDVGEEDPAELPACSCNCCNVAARRPDEVFAGASIKCSLSSDSQREACSHECVAPADDKILRFASEQVLDHQRYCFFECKPAEGVKSPLQTQCIALEASEAKQVVDKDGNALDPAIVYASSRQKQQSLIAAHASPAPAPGVSPQAAATAAQAAGKHAKVASQAAFSVAARVRDKEASLAGSLWSRLQTMAFSAYGTVADIHESANTAEAAAESAAEAAASAAEALKQARASSWSKANIAADEAVVRTRQDASAKMQLMLDPPKTLRERAAEAAADASMPYLHEAANLQAVVGQYSDTAKQLAEQGMDEKEKAASLRMEAQQIRNAAGIVGAGENIAVQDWDKRIANQKAELKLSEARAHLRQAEFLSQQRDKVLGRMHYAGRAIPLYKEYAEAAAVSGAYNSNPAWVPMGYQSR